MKTQQAGGDASGTNDINDPIVQDVLNEFQEELMLSKQPKMPPQHASQHSQHSQHASQHSQPPLQVPYMPPQYPPHPPHHHGYPQSKYGDISSYMDTEVAKKSLILVILAVIIYHSGIINTMYEKMPDNLQDNLNNFDIYIKSASLFAIIYVLTFFEYI
jgi:hypothetical protein